MKPTTKIIVISSFLAFCGTSLANELLVPSDYPSIQSAIDAAVNGDTILVAPGTYTGDGNYDIDFKGKAITVRSQSGPDNCIIDCNRHGGFNFHGGEDVNSILKGFIITDGYGRSGGAIYCDNSSPKIIECIITGNYNTSRGIIYCQSSHPEIIDCNITANSGSGIYCSGSNALITGCKISGNSTGRYGGGIYCEGLSNPAVTNCIISGNTASNYGGGIFCDYQCNLTVTNCTITGNSASSYYGGGIYCGSYGSSKINQCIFWNNSAPTSPEIYGNATVTYSVIQGGCWGQGNINADPLLTPDGRLQASSPCIDAGDPDFLPEPGQVDIDGQPRVMGGRVDIGADEVTAPLVSAIILSSKNFYFQFNQGGPAPPAQILSIQNLLQDTLNWEVTEDCPWLEVHPNTGSSTNQPSDITLSVDITGLAPGVYNCTLTISSPTAAPRVVPVILCIYSPELLLVPIEYPTIQSAIDAAVSGDTIVVTPGIYTGEGNRDIDFLGKAVTVRSIAPNDPNIVAQTVIDCNGIDIYDRHHGFSFQSGEDANSVLAGFTITNSGWAAIGCSNYSSPIITNCVITKNTGSGSGAISCAGDSRPLITNCTISNNSGSGISCETMTSPVITNCTISNNIGSGRSGDGGGISVLDGLCLIYNSVISGNNVNGRGGGICCYRGSGSIAANNCVITGNSAGNDGGAIYCDSRNTIKITNCTISGNSAKRNGGGIFLANTSSLMPITNSIIWGNTDISGQSLSAQIYGGLPNVWFSCVQDDNPNDANIPFGADNFNIDDNPRFVAPGFWDANFWHNGDYHLLTNSPCIETGNPSFTYHPGDTDIDGQPRLMGRYIDIGADEFDTKMIVVTKPKGGEVWTSGSTHEITWDSNGITGTVKLSYSTNNGATWTKIASAPDTGTFLWHLPVSQFPPFCHKPPIDSNKCLVLVESNAPTPNLTCIESGLFTIQPYRNWPPQPWWPGYPHRQFGPKYGCVKWQFQTGGPVTAGVTIGLNNRVHVPCEDGKLYTLNAGSVLLWTYDTNSPLVCSPAVDRSGNVYIGAENGKLYAIDKFGRLLWTHTTDGPIYSSPVVLFDDPWCGYICPYWKKHCPPWEQPLQIFTGSVDGALYALAQDGSELWSFETDSISAAATGAIFASPAIDRCGNLHIAGIYDTNLYALDSDSADIIWNRTFPDPCRPYSEKPWPFASPVVAEDGTIYQAMLYDPNLYAINPTDGNIIWSTNLADPCSGWFEPNYAQIYGPPACWSKPALAPNGTIYVNLNDPYLRAVNPNGTIKWVTKLGTIGGFTLTVGADGLIYAASDDARLYVVDPNGQQVSQFEGFGGLSFPTITAGRTIIISDANNTVWAIGGYNCCGQPSALHRLEDLNGDGIVDDTDLAALTADWLECTDPGPPCNYSGDQTYLKGDLNKDLHVDFADFARLANRWLNKE
jgi:parallel beta-helix repeat protein